MYVSLWFLCDGLKSNKGKAHEEDRKAADLLLDEKAVLQHSDLLLLPELPFSPWPILKPMMSQQESRPFLSQVSAVHLHQFWKLPLGFCSEVPPLAPGLPLSFLKRIVWNWCIITGGSSLIPCRFTWHILKDIAWQRFLPQTDPCSSIQHVSGLAACCPGLGRREHAQSQHWGYPRGVQVSSRSRPHLHQGSDLDINTADGSSQVSKPKRTNCPSNPTFPRQNIVFGDAESLST